MVRFLLVASLLFASVADAARLSAQLDRSTAALGEPVSLTIEAQGLSLDALDAAPLAPTFDVFARTLSRGADSETLVLTLYPRLPGKLRIPALAVDGRATRELPLTVTDGSENVPRVAARWSLDPAAPRVGQPARLSLEICDDGSLQWQRPALPTLAGGILRTLGEELGEGEHAGEPCTLQRFHWALLATRAGSASVGVAMLDAARFGARLRFPGPTLAYEAAPLPAWLPEHVPPLEPTLVAGPLPARWPLGRPLSRRFEVSGGYSADGLKALLAPQLRDSPELALYPPVVEALEADDPNSPLTRYAVTLFWQPRAGGDVVLPTLRLPWYDPVRGRLAASVVAGGTLTVFDPRWRWAGQVAGALAALALIAAGGWQLRRTLRWRLARRQGLRAIRAAASPAGLALAVRGFSLRGAGRAASLGEWQRRLAGEARGCDVSGAVRELEQQRYGAAAIELDVLQQAFLRALSRARPRRRAARKTF